jgi:hypothetical protein
MITVSETALGNVDLVVMKDMEFEITSLSTTEFVLNPEKNPNHRGYRISEQSGSFQVRNTIDSPPQMHAVAE